MTVQEILQVRLRQHQADAELLQALQAAAGELDRITQQRNNLAQEVERLKPTPTKGGDPEGKALLKSSEK